MKCLTVLKEYFNKLKNKGYEIMETYEKLEILKNLSNNPYSDIDLKTAILSTQDFKLDRVKKYSMDHYRLIYIVLEKKLETMTTKLEQNAYIECLEINYKALENDKFIQYILTVLVSEKAIGFIFDLSNNIHFKIIFFIIYLILFCQLIYKSSTRKWLFYSKIFNQLKEKIKK